ncbi:MAG: L,D-transpeptidase family protein [Owenweeksia sp.]
MRKPVVVTLTLLIALTGGLLAYARRKANPLPTDKPIDRLVVKKSKRVMYVMSNDEIIKTYRIALGFNPVGHKEYEGDGKTPEGVYTINDRNPNSGYFRNLGVSYPNDEDKAHARELGKSPGGDIKIHGLKNGYGYIGKLHRQRDWTWGCIAVTNEEMQELYDNVPMGTVIEIKE